MNSLLNLFNLAVFTVTDAALNSGFATYSGLSAGNLSALLKLTIVGLVVALIAWGISAEWRAWSTSRSESLSLLSIMLRGGALFAFIGILLGIL